MDCAYISAGGGDGKDVYHSKAKEGQSFNTNPCMDAIYSSRMGHKTQEFTWKHQI